MAGESLKRAPQQNLRGPMRPTRGDAAICLLDAGKTVPELAAAMAITQQAANGYAAKWRKLRGKRPETNRFYMKGTLAERLALKTNKEGPIHSRLGTRCWLAEPVLMWGYAELKDTRGEIGPPMLQHKAHRVAYMLHHGVRLDVGTGSKGVVVRHKCDVKNCVNPDHLELGTQQDNINDKLERGRSYNPKLADCRCSICHEKGHRRNRCPQRSAA